MGFVSNLFGGGGGGASNPSGNPYTGQLGSLAGQQQQVASNIPPIASQLGDLASTEQSYAGQILPTALGQYTAGATGQLTPAMQALSDQALKQANLGTAGTYSNLGLSGSTMEQTDLGANTLQNEAEQANLAAQEESLGLAGLGEGRAWEGASGTALGQEVGAYGTEGNILGQAGTSLANAGQQYNTEMQQLMQTLSGLGNKSSGGLGGGIQNIGSGIGGLFGLGGSGAGNAALDVTGASGGFDLGTGAATAGAVGGDLGLGAGTAAAADAAAGGSTIADLLPLLAFA